MAAAKAPTPSWDPVMAQFLTAGNRAGDVRPGSGQQPTFNANETPFGADSALMQHRTASQSAWPNAGPSALQQHHSLSAIEQQASLVQLGPRFGSSGANGLTHGPIGSTAKGAVELQSGVVAAGAGQQPTLHANFLDWLANEGAQQAQQEQQQQQQQPASQPGPTPAPPPVNNSGEATFATMMQQRPAPPLYSGGNMRASMESIVEISEDGSMLGPDNTRDSQRWMHHGGRLSPIMSAAGSDGPLDSRFRDNNSQFDSRSKRSRSSTERPLGAPAQASLVQQQHSDAISFEFSSPEHTASAQHVQQPLQQQAPAQQQQPAGSGGGAAADRLLSTIDSVGTTAPSDALQATTAARAEAPDVKAVAGAATAVGTLSASKRPPRGLSKLVSMLSASRGSEMDHQSSPLMNSGGSRWWGACLSPSVREFGAPGSSNQQHSPLLLTSRSVNIAADGGSSSKEPTSGRTDLGPAGGASGAGLAAEVPSLGSAAADPATGMQPPGRRHSAGRIRLSAERSQPSNGRNSRPPAPGASSGSTAAQGGGTAVAAPSSTAAAANMLLSSTDNKPRDSFDSDWDVMGPADEAALSAVGNTLHSTANSGDGSSRRAAEQALESLTSSAPRHASKLRPGAPGSSPSTSGHYKPASAHSGNNSSSTAAGLSGGQPRVGRMGLQMGTQSTAAEDAGRHHDASSAANSEQQRQGQEAGKPADAARPGGGGGPIAASAAPAKPAAGAAASVAVPVPKHGGLAGVMPSSPVAAASPTLASRMIALQKQINALSDEDLLNPSAKLAFMSGAPQGLHAAPNAAAAAPRSNASSIHQQHLQLPPPQQQHLQQQQQQPFVHVSNNAHEPVSGARSFLQMHSHALQHQQPGALPPSGGADAGMGALGALSALLASSPVPSRATSMLRQQGTGPDALRTLGTMSLGGHPAIEEVGPMLMDTLDREVRDSTSVNGLQGAMPGSHVTGFATRTRSYMESVVDGSIGANGGGAMSNMHLLFSTGGSSHQPHPVAGPNTRYASDTNSIAAAMAGQGGGTPSSAAGGAAAGAGRFTGAVAAVGSSVADTLGGGQVAMGVASDVPSPLVMLPRAPPAGRFTVMQALDSFRADMCMASNANNSGPISATSSLSRDTGVAVRGPGSTVGSRPSLAYEAASVNLGGAPVSAAGGSMAMDRLGSERGTAATAGSSLTGIRRTDVRGAAPPGAGPAPGVGTGSVFRGLTGSSGNMMVPRTGSHAAAGALGSRVASAGSGAADGGADGGVLPSGGHGDAQNVHELPANPDAVSAMLHSGSSPLGAGAGTVGGASAPGRRTSSVADSTYSRVTDKLYEELFAVGGVSSNRLPEGLMLGRHLSGHDSNSTAPLGGVADALSAVAEAQAQAQQPWATGQAGEAAGAQRTLAGAAGGASLPSGMILPAIPTSKSVRRNVSSEALRIQAVTAAQRSVEGGRGGVAVGSPGSVVGGAGALGTRMVSTPLMGSVSEADVAASAAAMSSLSITNPSSFPMRAGSSAGVAGATMSTMRMLQGTPSGATSTLSSSNGNPSDVPAPPSGTSFVMSAASGVATAPPAAPPAFHAQGPASSRGSGAHGPQTGAMGISIAGSSASLSAALQDGSSLSAHHNHYHHHHATAASSADAIVAGMMESVLRDGAAALMAEQARAAAMYGHGTVSAAGGRQYSHSHGLAGGQASGAGMLGVSAGMRESVRSNGGSRQHGLVGGSAEGRVSSSGAGGGQQLGEPLMAICDEHGQPLLAVMQPGDMSSAAMRLQPAGVGGSMAGMQLPAHQLQLLAGGGMGIGAGVGVAGGMPPKPHLGIGEVVLLAAGGLVIVFNLCIVVYVLLTMQLLVETVVTDRGL